MGTAINTFVTCFIIFLALAVLVPIIKTALADISSVSNDATGIEKTVLGSNYISIILNVVAVAFWTFGLNVWINLFILVPLRIIMLASAWYIISPAK